ncbi:MAG: DUF4160 domain-containing protein, partial [Candidatus Limnocylindria bacterium]
MKADADRARVAHAPSGGRSSLLLPVVRPPEPPHVHVSGGGGKAKVWLMSVRLERPAEPPIFTPGTGWRSEGLGCTVTAKEAKGRTRPMRRGCGS